MSTAQAQAGQAKYTDALELAFDRVKEVENAEHSITQRERLAETAQLWVGIAVAVELRRLREDMATGLARLLAAADVMAGEG